MAFRNKCSGVIHEFNLGRFTWLMPVLWYLSFAYSIKIILNFLNRYKGKAKTIRFLASGLILCAYLTTA